MKEINISARGDAKKHAIFYIDNGEIESGPQQDFLFK